VIGMRGSLVVGAFIATLGIGTAAQAGPTMRFGLTFAAEDQSSDGEHSFGPILAAGYKAGPLTAEIEWAYLSYMSLGDPGPQGMQRLGLTLRGDIWRTDNGRCLFKSGCTRSRAMYLEAGAAERFGEWGVGGNNTELQTTSYRQREFHAGVGFEMDNHTHPTRWGWQVGLRFAVAPTVTDEMLGTSCRSTGDTGCPTADKKGTDASVMLEWAFLFAKG
jgi:hypothetical protein